jgi:hypothetical protein
MSMILACIDASAAARPVLQTAAALGHTLTLPVVALHVRGDDTDPPRQFADAAGVQQATRRFAGSGVEIVALHVFDAATVPRFWDRPSTTTTPGERSSWLAGARPRALAWSCAPAGPAGTSLRSRPPKGPT